MVSSISACRSFHVEEYEKNILSPILLCGTDKHEILTSIRANRSILNGVIVDCGNNKKSGDVKLKITNQHCDMDLGKHIYRLNFRDNKLISYQKLERKNMIMSDEIKLCD